MMDHTDKHFRYLIRLLTKHTVLYTEMITTGALIHGNYKQFLKYNSDEHPIGIQLGGNNPKELLECAHMAENEGYDEVNLNIGCPSDRVQKGKFGSSLMNENDLVADFLFFVRTSFFPPVCPYGKTRAYAAGKHFQCKEIQQRSPACRQYPPHTPRFGI